MRDFENVRALNHRPTYKTDSTVIVYHVWLCLCIPLGNVHYVFCMFTDGEFEALEVTALSSPPELPDVMKPQDSPSTHVQEQVTS